MHDVLLPTQAKELLTPFVGARLVTVHSQTLGELASERLTLTTDRGVLVCLPDPKRLSVTLHVSDAPPVGEDISTNELFRYRLRRPIQSFFAWKSYDVSEREPELEFGLELVLQTVPGFAIEYVHSSDEHDAFLMLTLGKSQDRCRRLWVA